MSFRNRLKTIIGDDATVLSATSRLLFYIKTSDILHKAVAKVLGTEKQQHTFNPIATDAATIRQYEEQAKTFQHTIHFHILIHGKQLQQVTQTKASIEQQLGQGFVFSLYTEAHTLPSAISSTHYALFLEAGDELSKDALMCITQYLNNVPALPLCVYFDSFNSRERLTVKRYVWSPDTLLNHNYINNACVFRLDGISIQPADSSAYVRCYQLLLESAKIEKPQILPLVLLNEQKEKSSNDEGDKLIIENWIQQEKLPVWLLPGNSKEDFYVQYTVSGNPLVSIVIPTKNKSELVKQCVDSIIQKSTYRNVEIILVDNRSDEKELFALVEQYQQQITFKHVRADIDFNFSALMNIGSEQASGSFLVLLNNDTEIITPQWLEYLLGYAQQKHVGAVGCKLLYPNYIIQHAGVVVDKKVISKHIYMGEDRYALGTNRVANYPAVTAACLMIEKQKLTSVGGFDEQFNVEYNDIDLCLSLRKAGYHNVYLPQVELFHYESASRRHPFSDRKNHERHLKETLLMKDKWKELFA
ncbi:MAG: glycosyltransferase family 2 protein [Bacteroidota bacterium]